MNIFFTAFKLGRYDEALRYILNVDVMLKSTKLFKEKDTKDLVVEMTVGTFVKSGNCRKAVQYFQKKSEETKAGQRKIVYRGLPYCCCCWGFTVFTEGIFVPVVVLENCPIISADLTVTA